MHDAGVWVRLDAPVGARPHPGRVVGRHPTRSARHKSLGISIEEREVAACDSLKLRVLESPECAPSASPGAHGYSNRSDRLVATR